MKTGMWLCLVAALAGCGVSQSKYDAVAQEAEQQKKEVAELRQKLADTNERADKLQSALGLAAAAQTTTEQQKAQLEEAKHAIEEAESRAKLQNDLIGKLQKLIDAGQLKIVVRRSQIVLALSNDVLFDTGETEVKADGKKAIHQVAQVLRGVTGKRFQIAGHTDVAPIVSAKKKEFPTNWELSAARSIAVVKLLVSDGVNPASLSAAGYGPHDPVASNATPDGQAKNRRIEITLQPNVGEILTTVAPDKAAPPADKKP
jgi:chemotaxis protein MotB